MIGFLRQMRAGAALLVWLAMALVWLALPQGRPRAAWRRLGWRLLLRGFGVRITVHGRPAPGAGTLYVANHVSWADIAVLGALVEAGFIAKSEVAAWPFVGRMARVYGCLFVARERRGEVAEQARAVASRLAAGPGGLVLFAEGTTGEGSTVMPFRSSLLALGEGAACVQPVAMVYRRRDGQALGPAGRRMVAWLDEDELLPHAFALAAQGGAVAEVWFEPPVPLAGQGRKALTAQLQAQVAARVAQRHV